MFARERFDFRVKTESKEERAVRGAEVVVPAWGGIGSEVLV